MEWRPSFSLGNYFGSSSLLKGTSLVKSSLAPSAAVQPLRQYIPVQLSACMDLLATASASCSGRIQGAWEPCKPYFATPKLASLPSLPSLRLARASLPSLPSLRLNRRGSLASVFSSPATTTPCTTHASSHSPAAASPGFTTKSPPQHTTRVKRATACTTLRTQHTGVVHQAHTPPTSPSTRSVVPISSGAHAACAVDAVPDADAQASKLHSGVSSELSIGVGQGDLPQITHQSHPQQRPSPVYEVGCALCPQLPPQPPLTATSCQRSAEDHGWMGSIPNLAPPSFHQSPQAAYLTDLDSNSSSQAFHAEHGKGWFGLSGPQKEDDPDHCQSGLSASHDPATAAAFAASAAACSCMSSPSSLAKPPPWQSPFRPHPAQARCPPPCALATATAVAATAAGPATCTAGTAAAAAAGPVISTKAVAVVLGYAVLIGSCFRSVPQILKVVRAQSTEGLSLVSNIVELLCYTIIVAYNLNQGYAFNTYGEVLACWFQDIILVALIFRHTNTPLPIAIASGSVFALLCSFLFQPGACPSYILGLLQMSSVFIMALGSRIPQIMLNVRRGNAGMMSLTTCLLNVAGNTTRIFTTLVLTKDMYILSACSTQFVLNSILLWQCISTRKDNKAKQRVRESSASAGPEVRVSKGVEGGAVGVGKPHVLSNKMEGYNNKWGGPHNSGGGFNPGPMPA